METPHPETNDILDSWVCWVHKVLFSLGRTGAKSRARRRIGVGVRGSGGGSGEGGILLCS